MPKPLNFINGMTLTMIESPPMKRVVPGKRSIPDLLAPLEKIAADSSSLVGNHGASFRLTERLMNCRATCSSDRRRGRYDPRRDFAGVHGDEPEGCMR